MAASLVGLDLDGVIENFNGISVREPVVHNEVVGETADLRLEAAAGALEEEPALVLVEFDSVRSSPVAACQATRQAWVHWRCQFHSQEGSCDPAPPASA